MNTWKNLAAAAIAATFALGCTMQAEDEENIDDVAAEARSIGNEATSQHNPNTGYGGGIIYVGEYPFGGGGGAGAGPALEDVLNLAWSEAEQEGMLTCMNGNPDLMAYNREVAQDVLFRIYDGPHGSPDTYVWSGASPGGGDFFVQNTITVNTGIGVVAVAAAPLQGSGSNPNGRMDCPNKPISSETSDTQAYGSESYYTNGGTKFTYPLGWLWTNASSGISIANAVGGATVWQPYNHGGSADTQAANCRQSGNFDGLSNKWEAWETGDSTRRYYSRFTTAPFIFWQVNVAVKYSSNQTAWPPWGPTDFRWCN